MATATTTSNAARADEEIQREVVEELGWDAQVQPNEIGVAVRNGIVTLTGWVDSYAKKWAAERSAHRLRRVRGVANDVEVRLDGSGQRTDGDIGLAVTQGLEWDAVVPSDRLDVTVANGWVMLRGEVEWDYQKRAAERAVRRLTGVRGVTNLIAVRPPAEPAARLEGEIQAALGRTGVLDAERIKVDVQDAVVVLSGSVQRWIEREEAERVAWCAPGVTSVANQLTVAV